MNLKSLKFKIPMLFTGYLLIMILISAALVINSVQKNALEEKLSKNADIAELMSKKIEIYLDMAMVDIVTSANLISSNEKTEDNIYYEINRMFYNYPNFGLVFFTNVEGRMVYSNPYNPIAINEKTYTDRDYFQHIIEYQEPYISQLYVSRVLGRPHFVVAAPVFHDGELYGLMAGGIPLKSVKDVVLSSDVKFNGGIWVVDSNGSLIVNPYEDLDDLEISVFENNPVEMDGESTDIYSVISNNTRVNITMERDNEIYYLAVNGVEGSSMTVIVEQEETVLLNEAYKILNDLKYISFIIVALGIIIGFIISLGVTRPIEKLVSMVRDWSAGDNKFGDLSIIREDEIGELANTFRDMTVSLDIKVEELKKSIERENRIQQYLNNILMSVGSGIVVIDSKENIVIFNKAAENITGYASNSMIGSRFTFLSDSIHFDLAKLVSELQQMDNDILEKEGLIFKKEKRNIPCRILCTKVKNSSDEEIGYVFLFINLEVFKKMEEELKREDRLSIVGEFSSSIIHDIGNPLAGLSNLLELYKSNATTDEEKSEILVLIEDEINELNQIVLEFLNFTKSEDHVDINVDVCQIVVEAVNILRAEMINRDVKIHTSFERNVMYASVDRRNFKQAIINIIKNSVQAINDNGHIFIDIKETNEKIHIVIKDTGIGIKDDELKNIFEPFYTTKKDGTGLGLSTAYKTIRDNDGRLEVSSKYKEGTEFIITIPNRRLKR
ncbi:MAG: PAS/PAC sensor signal transduction histidine kinase [Clostridiales bacterium 38_11]|nr:MAG: PAS/PAC sensor signal transduction histidine kinase [Clostridiales bacterium 38_11]